MKSVGSKTGLVLAGIVFVSLAGVSAKAASFEGLGDLPGGSFSSSAYGVSADGSVVVGNGWSASGIEAFRWTEASGMVGLGDLPGGIFESWAEGVSADGSVVVGQSESASGYEAFRWTDLNGNGLVDPNEKLDYHPELGLGDLPGGDFFSEVGGASADGSVVVGQSKSASGDFEAFHWTAAGGMVDLGDLPGGSFDRGYAWGVSADGSVVVGYSNPASGQEAFRWTDLNGNGLVDPDEKLDYHPEFGLGDLPGGSFSSWAYDVSADGSVVVGGGHSASGDEAFRWIDLNGNGLVDPNEKLDYHPEFGLGDLPGGSFGSYAWGVSADGSVVVGVSYSASGGDAFIWDATNGMRSLKDVLENDFGLDLTGWTLTSAEGISDDGSTIVGWGDNPSGDWEAWIATLTCDYELAGDMNDDCRVDFLDVALMAGNWLIDCNATPAEAACISK